MEPGKCTKFAIELHSYAPMEDGFYQVAGDMRYAEGTIEVPNPCELVYVPGLQEEAKHSKSWDMDDDDDMEDMEHSSMYMCPRHPWYPQDSCSYACDYDNVEWNIDMTKHSYSEDYDETTFVYEVSTDYENKDVSCNEGSMPITMTSVYIRLACTCEPVSETYLRSITSNMHPVGDIGQVNLY